MGTLPCQDDPKMSGSKNFLPLSVLDRAAWARFLDHSFAGKIMMGGPLPPLAQFSRPGC